MINHKELIYDIIVKAESNFWSNDVIGYRVTQKSVSNIDVLMPDCVPAVEQQINVGVEEIDI